MTNKKIKFYETSKTHFSHFCLHCFDSACTATARKKQPTVLIIPYFAWSNRFCFSLDTIFAVLQRGYLFSYIEENDDY